MKGPGFGYLLFFFLLWVTPEVSGHQCGVCGSLVQYMESREHHSVPGRSVVCMAYTLTLFYLSGLPEIFFFNDHSNKKIRRKELNLRLLSLLSHIIKIETSKAYIFTKVKDSATGPI